MNNKRPRSPSSLTVTSTLMFVIVLELAFMSWCFTRITEAVKDIQTTQNYFYGRKGD